MIQKRCTTQNVFFLWSLNGKAWGTPAEVWSFYIMYFGQLEDIWDPEKCSKEWFSPLRIWFSVMSVYVRLPCITNIQHRNTPNLLFVDRCFKAFCPKKIKNICFFSFLYFFSFFMYFFLTSKQICIFTFFENPCFAFKNNTKSSSFTKNMLKMITI